MSPVVEKERELSDYLEEWVAARYGEWNDIYRATNRDRHTGIYRLESGDKLLQLLYDIIGNIEDHLSVDKNCHLIPSQFSSISQLLQFLENFQQHIKRHFYLIDRNIKGVETDMVVVDMFKMCNDIDQMVTRCQSIYLTDNSIPIPYQQTLAALRNNDVQQFVELIGSLIKNIPYNMHKEKLDEGYFHTIIHTITSILGMTPVSEAETADGRIDTMIEFPNRIYIMEFKYSADNKDRAEEAFKQIIDKEYAQAYFIRGKIIDGVGMSFSQESRNVDFFVHNRLYTPRVNPYMI